MRVGLGGRVGEIAASLGAFFASLGAFFGQRKLWPLSFAYISMCVRVKACVRPCVVCALRGCLLVAMYVDVCMWLSVWG